MIEKRGGSGGGRDVKKIYLVMKSNKNVNILHCGEYLLVNTG